eukprot:Hpha_TRINITY_DN15854_c1_g4::TRINITY_DN15854_c1_g4_i1::g.188033::m.188033
MSLLPAACRLDVDQLLGSSLNPDSTPESVSIHEGSLAEAASLGTSWRRLSEAQTTEGGLSSSGQHTKPELQDLLDDWLSRGVEGMSSSGVPSVPAKCLTPEPELLSADETEEGEAARPAERQVTKPLALRVVVDREVTPPPITPRSFCPSPTQSSCTRPSEPPSGQCPCTHNSWDDVRTRRHAKMLRCRVCQGKWRLPSTTVPRCRAFFDGHCSMGERCQLLHVHKKKQGVQERLDKFGPLVLDGQALNEVRTSPVSRGGSVRDGQSTSAGHSAPHSQGSSPRARPPPVSIPVNPYFVALPTPMQPLVTPTGSTRRPSLPASLPAALPLHASGVWPIPAAYAPSGSEAEMPMGYYDPATPSSGVTLVRLPM